MNTYIDIKEKTFRGFGKKDCFWAFNEKQFEKEVKKRGLEGQPLISSGYGLYGTVEGLKDYVYEAALFYEEIGKEIEAKCTPQEVYDYEFANHECGYTGDDTEAMEAVVWAFGIDRAMKEVKRMHG